MTLISGLSVALMRPKIAATASSVPTLVQPLPASSSIPGTAQVATPRAAADTRTRSKNLMDQILLESGTDSRGLGAAFPGLARRVRGRGAAGVLAAPVVSGQAGYG